MEEVLPWYLGSVAMMTGGGFAMVHALKSRFETVKVLGALAGCVAAIGTVGFIFMGLILSEAIFGPGPWAVAFGIGNLLLPMIIAAVARDITRRPQSNTSAD